LQVLLELLGSQRFFAFFSNMEFLPVVGNPVLFSQVLFRFCK